MISNLPLLLFFAIFIVVVVVAVVVAVVGAILSTNTQNCCWCGNGKTIGGLIKTKALFKILLNTYKIYKKMKSVTNCFNF